MAVPFIVTNDGSISMVVKGKPYLIGVAHPFHKRLKREIGKLTEQQVTMLLSKTEDKYIKVKSKDGKVKIENGQVWYNNEPLNIKIAQKVLNLYKNGYDVDSFVKFMEELMKNPSMSSVEELYDFLSSHGLTITDDGHFLAYKAVRSDFRDKYTGKIDNSVGKTPEVPRNTVDDDRRNECSYGLHVGGLQYVRMYASPGDVVVLCKINPKDAVAVPKDENFLKMRVCKYQVMSVVKDPLIQDAVYDNSGKSLYNEDDPMDDREYNVTTGKFVPKRDSKGRFCS